jgi:hypothetical protein
MAISAVQARQLAQIQQQVSEANRLLQNKQRDIAQKQDRGPIIKR